MYVTRSVAKVIRVNEERLRTVLDITKAMERHVGTEAEQEARCIALNNKTDDDDMQDLLRDTRARYVVRRVLNDAMVAYPDNTSINQHAMCAIERMYERIWYHLKQLKKW